MHPILPYGAVRTATSLELLERAVLFFNRVPWLRVANGRLGVCEIISQLSLTRCHRPMLRAEYALTNGELEVLRWGTAADVRPNQWLSGTELSMGFEGRDITLGCAEGVGGIYVGASLIVLGVCLFVAVCFWLLLNFDISYCISISTSAK